MSEVEHDSTEEKIKVAAKELFLKNGMKGTTIREVAERAGTNLALVNYYYRSKNKLFISVFKEKFSNFSETGYHILYNTSLSFQDRIMQFIDHKIDLFNAEPNLPIFILSESHYNAELLEILASAKLASVQKHKDKIQQILDEECEQGNIKKILLRDLEMTMVSMLVFPFIAKNMMAKTAEFEELSFEEFIENWRSHVKQVVLSFIKPS